MSVLKFQDTDFDTKQELFKHLRDNHDRLIKNKKAALKFTDSAPSFNYTLLQNKNNTTKELSSYSWMKEGYVYAVINTTNYLDSHNDVHLDGIWNKSAVEQNGKTLWIVNHDLSIGSEVAYEKDVNIMIQKMSFRDLGFDSDKNTEALIFEVKQDAIINENILDRILKNIATQHSIRMQYIELVFCMDSDAEEDREYKVNYDKYAPSVANYEKVKDQMYFWGVKVAAIKHEGSSVVAGSNDITPMLIGKSIEPSKGTQLDEPSADTQKEEARKRVLLNMAKVASK